MWKAEGEDKARQPANWLASADAQKFIEFMEEVNPRISGTALVYTKKGGKNPGTWAHWQIALAYARYLSPEFHAYCNSIVRAHMEGKLTTRQPEYNAEMMEMIRHSDGICRMLSHKITVMEKTIETMSSLVQPNQSIIIIQGKTAGEILKDNGFSGVKGLAGWLGNRLETFGCRISDNRRGYLGVSRARLFDPNKSDLYLRNGGRSAIRQKIQERQGQGKLRLVAIDH